MKKKFLFPILGMIVLSLLHGQESRITTPADSISSNSLYQLWIDIGNYPLWWNSHSSTFVPTFNARVGIGKSFQDIQFYGFAELTMHKFDTSDDLFFYKSSNKRYDIALYGMGSVAQIFYLGAGIYYTHQDNIVTHHFFNQDTTYNSGIRSYFRFYYVIGAGYQIPISNSISLPLGLYYRNQEYSEEFHWSQKISLRLGVMYAL